MVIFWHKACALAGAGVRMPRPGDEAGPPPQRIDYHLPHDVDLFAAIFKDEAADSSWSLNDVWHEVQKALDPFGEIEKGEPPVVRTARIAYPETVTVETPDGPQPLAELYLGMAMWIEPEFVTARDALKVDYASLAGGSLQRIEFSSARTHDWRLSLQAPAGSSDIADLRTGGNWPVNASERSPDAPERNQD
ncbi:hypothetical protein PMI01_04595 [Caulobacter sp. AP07]|nr:hypothetical protein PMI01_04595 [Caulobacter sp. AP07]